MIIVLRADYSPADLKRIIARLEDIGMTANPVIGEEKTLILGIGGEEHLKVDSIGQLRADKAVEDVLIVTKPYQLVARDSNPQGTKIDIRGAIIGGEEVAIVAGPCTVEDETTLMQTAKMIASAGAKFLRGGAYKPSTSPYSFQGLGVEGLRLLQQAAREYDLRVVTEVMDVRKVDLVCEYADVLQIGTRNMQNYDLLREVGKTKMPVLLKRGYGAKIKEWLLAAEHIANAGNENIILCERGIRTFEPATRNTLDLSAVPLIKQMSHLPILVDPSHGTGKRDLVAPMSKAAIACGADGLIIEVHPQPESAIKDGAQSLNFEQFRSLLPDLSLIAQAVQRTLQCGSGVEISR